MKKILSLLLICVSISACSQKQKAPPARNEKTQERKTAQISQGEYICWFNGSRGRRAIGDMTVRGNTYSGQLYGNGTYSFDPATKMVRFTGGGFDQRKNGDEWIGFFYKKGETFLDGSEGQAANDMLIVTKASDWNNGRKMAWIQQCDLK